MTALISLPQAWVRRGPARRPGGVPTSGLRRIRLLFGSFAIFTIVALLPALGHAPTPGWRAAGAVSLGLTAAVWVVLMRRGRLPWPLELVEFVALTVAAASVDDPMRALAVVYVGMNFRCLHDSRKRALLRAGQMFASFVAASAVVGGTALATSPDVLGQAPMFLMNAVIIGLLGKSLRTQDEHGDELTASAERFAALLHNASDVVRLIDRSGTVLYESDPVRSVLGLSPEETVGTDAFALVHPDDRPMVDDVFAQLLARPDAEASAQLRMRHRDGTWRRIEATGKNLFDVRAVAAMVINYRDVTERHELQERLRHRALHDPLTELPNRDLFLDRVDLATARVRRSGGFVAIAFIDLDDFKNINDGLGHAAGDAVLQATGQRLRTAMRASDMASRLGGDEFALLLEDVDDPGDAYDVAARVLEEVRQPIEIGGQLVTIRASLGIVLSRGEETADELVRRADLAMYEAKGQGKGRFEVFELGMHARVHERLTLRAALESAVAEGEIVAHYQPVVELESGGIVGAEALVRWAHPERGLLGPGEFMQVAEETGLIVDIGRIVLRDACRQVAEWNRSFGSSLSIHVNVSPRQLSDPGFSDDVAAVLADSGLAADRLTLEITETMLITDAESAAAVLAQLRSMGVRLALDDFGTGYSSLAHLQRFAVDVVKIDRSFVAAGDSREGGPFTSAIIGLGRTLGLDLVAEGIEEPEQAQRLRELGCPHGQGYLYARPMPALELAALIGATVATPVAAEVRA